MGNDFAHDYIDVAERIQLFRDAYPTGSLQPADPANPFRVVTVDGKTFIAVVAAAYRTPDDPRPGIGMAWEPTPGRTPFTRDSELQNAETSAWGRAIVATLAADTKRHGVASADEVRNREADRNTSRDPVTKDPEWVDTTVADLTACPDMPALTALSATIRARVDGREVSYADEGRLRAAFTAARDRISSMETTRTESEGANT